MELFLLGILSFTFWENLILLPFMVFLFSCFGKNVYLLASTFVAGIFSAYFLPFDIPYFLGTVLIFIGLRFLGFLKFKKTLHDKNVFIEAIFAFISGAIFFAYLPAKENFFFVAGLSIPFFLIACAFCGVGIYFKKSKSICGIVTIFYGTLFPVLKIFGVL